MIACALVGSSMARADEVPPYEPVRVQKPKPPPPPPPPAVEAPAPRRNTIELTLAFPMHSTVRSDVRDTSGQGVGFDVRAVRALGDGFAAGASLAWVKWRNFESSYVEAMNDAFRAGVFARYAYGHYVFRPYVQAGAAIGLSHLAPRFTIFEVPGRGSYHGTTTIHDANGLTYGYELSIGFSREISEDWTILGAFALRGMTVRHHGTFAQVGGATTDVDHLSFDSIDASLAVGYTF